MQSVFRNSILLDGSLQHLLPETLSIAGTCRLAGAPTPKPGRNVPVAPSKLSFEFGGKFLCRGAEGGQYGCD
jgi:hypothetical protein